MPAKKFHVSQSVRDAYERARAARPVPATTAPPAPAGIQVGDLADHAASMFAVSNSQLSDSLHFKLRILTGREEPVLKRLHAHCVANATRTTPQFVDIVAASIVIHMSLTFEQLALIMADCFQTNLSRSAWYARVIRVADICFSARLFELDYRYAARDDALFPLATVALDGVPVFIHGDDQHYNGKKKRKYISVQVAVDLYCRPVWCNVPVNGRVAARCGLGGWGRAPARLRR